MKARILTLILLSIFKLTVFSQQVSQNIFLANSKSDTLRYSLINFNSIDTLEKWCYEVSPGARIESQKKLKSIRTIRFSRISALYDTVGYSKFLAFYEYDKKADSMLQDNFWIKPGIEFSIFKIKDSAVVYNMAYWTNRTAGCVNLFRGADLFTLGNYIFFNTWDCTNCNNHFIGKTDHCRPLLNFIFKNMVIKNSANLNDILRQIPLQKCETTTGK